ncbi:hypothetical protein WN48_00046 [Eufriesea mexicana]|nr:hypothetical protein WN48_00046 [Eufriesea mexicana]
MPVREQRVDCHVLHVGGEAFVQPEVVPPFHGDQIAEPHVRQFMGDCQADTFHVHTGTVLAVKQLCLAECDQAPVLHGTSREISASLS